MDVEVDLLLTITAFALSMVFAYFPGLKDWFEALDPRYKPLFMAGVLLAVALGQMAYNCQFAWGCIQTSIGHTLIVWLMALAANQGSYMVFVEQFKRKDLA